MDDIEGEARTRIIWGEEPSVVVTFLSQNGYSAERAESFVNILLCERYRIVRRRGVHRILLGFPVLVVCGWILAESFSPDDVKIAFGSELPWGIGCLALGFFWGVWKCMDGLRDLLQPNRASGDLGFHGEQV